MRRKQVTAALKRRTFERRFLSLLAALLVLALIQACAPARVFRSSSPPTTSPAASSPPPQIASPSRVPGAETKAIVEEVKIKEEDLREKRSIPQPRVKDQRPRLTPGREAPSPIPDDSSLIAKITPRTPPQRAASLRLTEEGRKLLESGEYARALARLEKTIAIDSTNPYGYYYLAKAHYHMSRHQESLNFLDVAESLLASEPYWLAEVFALKGENFRALGFFQRADSSYSQALRLNPGNRAASEGLSRIREEQQLPLR